MIILLCARYYRRSVPFSKPSRSRFAWESARSAGKGILLAAGLVLMISCGTAAKRETPPEKPAPVETPRPEPGEKVPTLDDLRGYLLPERPAPRRIPS